jgi:serum/glucocorticoid-regulated kinase 2
MVNDGEEYGQMTDAELDAGLDRSLTHLYTNESVKRGVSVEDFDVVRMLGRGGYGEVLLVKHKDSGELYAMKTLIKAALKKRNVVKQTKAERSILQAIRHPFVVHLRFAFQTKTKLYLLTPFYPGGDLHYCLTQQRKRVLAKTRARAAEAKAQEAVLGGSFEVEIEDPDGRKEWGLPEDQIRLYAAELLLALEHLHQNGIIYRDLKASSNCSMHSNT